MKIFFKPVTIISSLLTSFIFSTCSNEEIEHSHLYGEWKSVYRYNWVKINVDGKKEDYNRDYNQAVFIFKPNYKCDFYDPESIICPSSYYCKDINWNVSSEHDQILYLTGDNVDRRIQIKKLTSNTLVVIEQNGYFVNGYGESKYEETIYKK